MRVFTISLCLVFYSLSTMAGEIVKWIDENGQVHYSDRVPKKYKKAATQIESDISVAGPEADVRNQNARYVQKLDRERTQETNDQARENVKEEQAKPDEAGKADKSQAAHLVSQK